MNQDLIKSLVALHRKYGTEQFYEAIADIHNGTLDMMAAKRGRRRQYDHFFLSIVWGSVEAIKQVRNRGITDACRHLSDRGGFTQRTDCDNVDKIKEHHVVTTETIRNVYYRANKYLRDRPVLRDSWETVVKVYVDAESRIRVGRTVIDKLEHQTNLFRK